MLVKMMSIDDSLQYKHRGFIIVRILAAILSFLSNMLFCTVTCPSLFFILLYLILRFTIFVRCILSVSCVASCTWYTEPSNARNKTIQIALFTDLKSCVSGMVVEQVV